MSRITASDLDAIGQKLPPHLAAAVAAGVKTRAEALQAGRGAGADDEQRKRSARRRAGRAAQRAGADAEAVIRGTFDQYAQRLPNATIAQRLELPSRPALPAALLRWAQPVVRVLGRGRDGHPRVKLLGKSGPDVTGFVCAGGQAVAVAVEVKANNGPSLSLMGPEGARIDDAQRATLQAYASAGAVAGVLTRIASPKPRGRQRPPPRWYYIPWREFAALEAAAQAIGRASLKGAQLDALHDAGRARRLAQPIDWLGAAIALRGAP